MWLWESTRDRFQGNIDLNKRNNRKKSKNSWINWKKSSWKLGIPKGWGNGIDEEKNIRWNVNIAKEFIMQNLF